VAATLGKRLSVKQLAAHYGRSERSIRRWLRKLDAEHGDVIKRSTPHGPIEVTLSSLRRADRDYLEEQAIARDEVGELRTKCSNLEKETIALRKRVRELQEIVVRLVERGQNRPNSDSGSTPL
jgi:transposase